MTISALSRSVLPAGIPSRFIDGVNGLRMHVLKVGFETGLRPGILLMHGFPELPYSWRRFMLPLPSRLSLRGARPAQLWPHHRLRWRL